jgi:hypothetical protein
LIRPWITLKIIEEFLDAVFLVVDVESVLGEAEASLVQTKVPVRKGNKFGSDHLIAIKFLQEFPDAGFRGVDVESQLGEAEVSLLQTRVPVRKGDNF